MNLSMEMRIAEITGKSLPFLEDLRKKIGTGIDPKLFLKNASLYQVEALGFTTKQAEKLCAAIALGKELAFSQPTQVEVENQETAAMWFQSMGLAFSTVEQFAVMTLNVRRYPIGIEIISRGTSTECLVSPAEVFRSVLRHGGDRCIVAHNHPSGNCQPSIKDLDMTRMIVEAGKVMFIPVLDHMIVSQRQYTSLRNENPTIWEESD